MVGQEGESLRGQQDLFSEQNYIERLSKHALCSSSSKIELSKAGLVLENNWEYN